MYRYANFLLLNAFFVLSLLSCAASRGEVRPTLADQDGFHTPSTLFKVRANGITLFAERFKSADYADFQLTGQAEIEVEYAGEIASATLSPLAREIDVKTRGNRMKFTLPGAGWYVLEVNGTDKLMLLANPVEQTPDVSSSDVISALDYVSDASGAEMQTEALQMALDEASRSGKTLFFPRGVYLTGTLTVGSGTDLYLADGAMIKGSSDRRDYPTDGDRPEADHVNNKANYSDNGEFMTFSRLILIDNAHHVTIRGRGTIDGSGTQVRAQGKPANLVRIRNSHNVLIEGIILRDPAAWNTHILHCTDVTVRGVKVLNDPDVPNTDGFDPDASKRVTIEGCFASCNDDNVAVKTTNNMDLLQDLEDVTIRGCVFLTRKSSLKVGTETKAAAMRNIEFSDNDVIECDRAFALYCNDGSAFENIRFVNNRVEKNYPDSQRKAIHFSIKERYGKGTIRNVTVQDCSFREAFPRGSAIDGLDSVHTIDNLVFENVTVGGKKITSLEDLGVKKNKFVENVVIR